MLFKPVEFENTGFRKIFWKQSFSKTMSSRWSCEFSSNKNPKRPVIFQNSPAQFGRKKIDAFSEWNTIFKLRWPSADGEHLLQNSFCLLCEPNIYILLNNIKRFRKLFTTLNLPNVYLTFPKKYFNLCFLCGCEAIRVINWDEFVFFLFVCLFFHGSRKL